MEKLNWSIHSDNTWCLSYAKNSIVQGYTISVMNYHTPRNGEIYCCLEIAMIDVKNGIPQFFSKDKSLPPILTLPIMVNIIDLGPDVEDEDDEKIKLLLIDKAKALAQQFNDVIVRNLSPTE